MRIYALDPGPDKSGFVIFDTDTMTVIEADGELANVNAIQWFRSDYEWPHHFACECIEAMYAHVGKETVRTIRFCGAVEEAVMSRGGEITMLSPQEVKKHICGTASAKDPAVRQALIDRFGGESAVEGPKKCMHCKGRTIMSIETRCECDDGMVRGVRAGTLKKCPRCKGREWIPGKAPCNRCVGGFSSQAGPLHSVSSHAWRALAVAVAVADLLLTPGNHT